MKFQSAFALLLLSATEVVADDASSTQSLRGLQDQQVCPTVDTVSNFDLNAYVSKPWYVHQQAVTIYSPLDQNFCTRAEYNVKDSPNFWGYTVDVSNYAQTADGNEAGGPLCAYQEDDNPAKLNVAPCFLPKFFAGPYWIINYEEGDEGYALISGGQPTITSEDNGGCKTGDGINNSGLWIFSRSRQRNETMISLVRQKAIDKGFDVSVLNDVQQEGCTYPDDPVEATDESSTDEDTEPPSECPQDIDGTFDTLLSGQRDCNWVAGWSSLRCIFYSDNCPVTCGHDECA